MRVPPSFELLSRLCILIAMCFCDVGGAASAILRSRILGGPGFVWCLTRRFCSPVLLLVLAFALPCRALDASLKAQLIGAQLQVTLTADQGVAYVLEASVDLKSWSPMAGISLSGPQSQVTLTPAGGVVFYRARLASGGGGGSLPTVTIQADSGNAAVAVISPEAGGVCRYVMPSGLTYTLSFPSNSVAEATLVEMTPVTSLAGVPAAQGFLGGVLIQPADLTLIEPASLRIDLTNHYAPFDLTGYGFQPDGSSWHLSFGFAGTNWVEVLLPTLGGVGCGLFTDAELMALPEPTLLTNLPPTPALSLQSLPPDCYPEEQTRAKRLSRFFQIGIHSWSETFAKELNHQRRVSQLIPSGPLTGTLLARTLELHASFYRDHVAPFVQEAAGSCAIGGEVMSWMRLLASHARRLGATEDAWAAPPSGFVCQVVKRCKEQARDCCAAGILKPGLLPSQFAAAERMASAFSVDGAGCPGPSLNDVTKDCLPQWYGHLLIRETFDQTRISHGSTLRGRLSAQTSYSYDADVLNSTLTRGPFYDKLELEFSVGAAGGYSSSGQSHDIAPCSCTPPPGISPASLIQLQDGCLGAINRDSALQGKLITNLTFKITFWIPASMGLPGIPSLDAASLAAYNSQQLALAPLSLPCAYKGAASKNSTCPEDQATNGTTAQQGQVTLGTRGLGVSPTLQVYSKDTIYRNVSKDESSETHDDVTDSSLVTHFFLKLDLHARQ